MNFLDFKTYNILPHSRVRTHLLFELLSLLPITISKSLILSKIVNSLVPDHQLFICTQNNINIHTINKA